MLLYLFKQSKSGTTPPILIPQSSVDAMCLVWTQYKSTHTNIVYSDMGREVSSTSTRHLYTGISRSTHCTNITNAVKMHIANAVKNTPQLKHLYQKTQNLCVGQAFVLNPETGSYIQARTQLKLIRLCTKQVQMLGTGTKGHLCGIQLQEQGLVLKYFSIFSCC